MRSSNEIIADRILTLFLVSAAEKSGGISGNVKFQKLVFLSEWNLIKRSIKGLHFKFFAYRLGPFSKELLLDHQDLVAKGYLTGGFALKEKAMDLLDYVLAATSDLKTNAEVLESIQSTCAEYGKYNAPRLMNLVYKMEIEPHDWPGKSIQIGKMPSFLDILVPEVLELPKHFELPDYLLGDIAADFESRELSETEKAQLDKATFDNFATSLVPIMNPSQKEEARNFLSRSNAPAALISKFN